MCNSRRFSDNLLRSWIDNFDPLVRFYTLTQLVSNSWPEIINGHKRSLHWPAGNHLILRYYNTCRFLRCCSDLFLPALFSYLTSSYTAALLQALPSRQAYTHDSGLLPNPRLSRRWQLSLWVNPAHFSSWLGTLASVFWTWLSPKHLQVTGNSRQKSRIHQSHWRCLNLCSRTSEGALFSEGLTGG